MIKFIGLDSSKLGLEFVNNKFIRFVSIVVIENDWMTHKDIFPVPVAER
jgi:hypothetical protein